MEISLPSCDKQVGRSQLRNMDKSIERLARRRFWTQVAGSFRHRLRTGAVGSGADLLKQWPLGEELSDHC